MPSLVAPAIRAGAPAASDQPALPVAPGRAAAAEWVHLLARVRRD
ncbi:hypothetical protein ACIQOF_00790 [Streptomyces sp. NPDC091265]